MEGFCGELKLCHEIVREMFSKKHSTFAWPFYKPVHANQRDYHEIIKTPMDLSTVKQKMDDQKYSSVEEFEKDVMLIFSNCSRYNSPSHSLTVKAKKLQEIFLKRMGDIKHKDVSTPVGSNDQSAQKREADSDSADANLQLIQVNNEIREANKRKQGELGETRDEYKNKKRLTEPYCLLCQEFGHTMSTKCATCLDCGHRGHVREDCDVTVAAKNQSENVAQNGQSNESISSEKMEIDKGNADTGENEDDEENTFNKTVKSEESSRERNSNSKDSMRERALCKERTGESDAASSTPCVDGSDASTDNTQSNPEKKQEMTVSMKRRLRTKHRIQREAEKKATEMLTGDDITDNFLAQQRLRDNFLAQQRLRDGGKYSTEKPPTQIHLAQSLNIGENTEEIRPDKEETKEDIITELKVLKSRTDVLKHKLRVIEEKEKTGLADKNKKYDIECENVSQNGERKEKDTSSEEVERDNNRNSDAREIKSEDDGDDESVPNKTLKSNESSSERSNSKTASCKDRKVESDASIGTTHINCNNDGTRDTTCIDGSSSSPNNLQNEIKILHLEVAKYVKKCLDMYMVGQVGTEPKNIKIKDSEEYTRMAKFFSHKMRAQIKETYEQYNRTLKGVAITEDNKEQIKVEIDMYFDTKPVVG